MEINWFLSPEFRDENLPNTAENGGSCKIRDMSFYFLLVVKTAFF